MDALLNFGGFGRDGFGNSGLFCHQIGILWPQDEKPAAAGAFDGYVEQEKSKNLSSDLFNAGEQPAT